MPSGVVGSERVELKMSWRADPGRERADPLVNEQKLLRALLQLSVLADDRHEACGDISWGLCTASGVL